MLLECKHLAFCMKMAGDWTRQFTKDFIDLYRELSCLWKVKSDDYRNRAMRDRAYAKLVEKAKEVTPDADVHLVKKKLNILRTIFRKEHSKVKKSKESGTGQVVKPKLWCYESLLFTADQDNNNTYRSVRESDSNGDFDPTQSVMCNIEEYNEMQVFKREVTSDNEDNGPHSYDVVIEPTDLLTSRANVEETRNHYIVKRNVQDDHQNYYWQLTKNGEFANSRPDRQNVEEQSDYCINQRNFREEELQEYNPPFKGPEVPVVKPDSAGTGTQFCIDPPASNRTPQPKCTEERNYLHHDLLSLTYSHLTKKIDECDIFGYNVAMKLRNITDCRQRLIAEKLINDALFEGQLGTLNVTSKIRTPMVSHCTFHRLRSHSPASNIRSRSSSPYSETAASAALSRDPV